MWKSRCQVPPPTLEAYGGNRNWLRNVLLFRQPNGLLLCSQQPATRHYPKENIYRPQLQTTFPYDTV
jgi:hypothetical protein